MGDLMNKLLVPKEFKFVKKQTRILRYNTEVISNRFQKSDLLQYNNNFNHEKSKIPYVKLGFAFV